MATAAQRIAATEKRSISARDGACPVCHARPVSKHVIEWTHFCHPWQLLVRVVM